MAWPLSLSPPKERWRPLNPMERTLLDLRHEWKRIMPTPTLWLCSFRVRVRVGSIFRSLVVVVLLSCCCLVVALWEPVMWWFDWVCCPSRLVLWLFCLMNIFSGLGLSCLGRYSLVVVVYSLVVVSYYLVAVVISCLVLSCLLLSFAFVSSRLSLWWSCLVLSYNYVPFLAIVSWLCCLVVIHVFVIVRSI